MLRRTAAVHLAVPTYACCAGIDAVLDQLLGHRAEVHNDLSRLDLMDLECVRNTARSFDEAVNEPC